MDVHATMYNYCCSGVIQVGLLEDFSGALRLFFSFTRIKVIDDTGALFHGHMVFLTAISRGYVSDMIRATEQRI
jgi:hypothetical protein